MTNQELLTRIQKLEPEIRDENTETCIVEPELPEIEEEDITICPEPEEEELPPEETIDYD